MRDSLYRQVANSVKGFLKMETSSEMLVTHSYTDDQELRNLQRLHVQNLGLAISTSGSAGRVKVK